MSAGTQVAISTIKISLDFSRKNLGWKNIHQKIIKTCEVDFVWFCFGAFSFGRKGGQLFFLGGKILKENLDFLNDQLKKTFLFEKRFHWRHWYKVYIRMYNIYIYKYLHNLANTPRKNPQNLHTYGSMSPPLEFRQWRSSSDGRILKPCHFWFVYPGRLAWNWKMEVWLWFDGLNDQFYQVAPHQQLNASRTK